MMSIKDVSLGIDIGGTNTAFGFVDKDGKCIYESSIPTCANEPAPMLFKRLHQEVEKIYTTISGKYKLIGIGIGAPNANYFKGTVEQPPNLNWGVVNILEILKQYYDLPSAITNDANAAAIGEMQFGAAKSMKDFVVITLGTGLGSGIVVTGSLYMVPTALQVKSDIQLLIPAAVNADAAEKAVLSLCISKRH